MFQVEIKSNDFFNGSEYVKISSVVKAIARVLLSNGSPNQFQAERDAWPFIHTGIEAGKIHPLSKILKPLSIEDYGTGVVSFSELVDFGKWCHRFDFVKQRSQAACPAKGEAGNIPGKMPRTTIGKVAITKAWEIEYETGKRATANQVIDKLKTMEKTHPDLVEVDGRKVGWITHIGDTKHFDTEACGKALKKWNDSRP